MLTLEPCVVTNYLFIPATGLQGEVVRATVPAGDLSFSAPETVGTVADPPLRPEILAISN